MEKTKHERYSVFNRLKNDSQISENGFIQILKYHRKSSDRRVWSNRRPEIWRGKNLKKNFASTSIHERYSVFKIIKNGSRSSENGGSQTPRRGGGGPPPIPTRSSYRVSNFILGLIYIYIVVTTKVRRTDVSFWFLTFGSPERFQIIRGGQDWPDLVSAGPNRRETRFQSSSTSAEHLSLDCSYPSSLRFLACFGRLLALVGVIVRLKHPEVSPSNADR